MNFFLPDNNSISIYKELKNKKNNYYDSLFINERFSWKNIFNSNFKTNEKLRKKVEEIHISGLYINYIFDPTCLGNLEFIKNYNNKIMEHLEFIEDIGVDYITISIPYLLEIILARYSGLTPVLSMYADIDNIQRIQFYEDMGVKEIILSSDLNRNFNLLKKLSKKTDISFHLVLNNTCVYGCPYQRSYQNNLSHFITETEKDIAENWFNTQCKELKSRHEEFIKSRWIRPEDIQFYIDLGFKNFHILDTHNKNNLNIINTLHSYRIQKYEGNLLGLLNSNLHEENNIFIDNQKFPDDFLHKFQDINCRVLDCSICGYCKDIAGEVIRSMKKTRGFKEQRI